MTTTAGSRTHTVFESPIGPLTLVAAEGALYGLYMAHQSHRPSSATFGGRAPENGMAPFGAAIEQLAAYFAGEVTDFNLPLDLRGTPFQRRVWAGLRDIAYGETITYGQLAEEIGSPGSARAVGLANGKNPIGIIVPCHRVIGSTGSLTGYGGGLERKRFLLDLEYKARAGTPTASPAPGRLF